MVREAGRKTGPTLGDSHNPRSYDATTPSQAEPVEGAVMTGKDGIEA